MFHKHVPFGHKPRQHSVVGRVEQNEEDQVGPSRHPPLWRRRCRAGSVNVERGSGRGGVERRHRHGRHSFFVFVGGSIGVLVGRDSAVAGLDVAAGRSRGMMLLGRQRRHAAATKALLLAPPLAL